MLAKTPYESSHLYGANCAMAHCALERQTPPMMQKRRIMAAVGEDYMIHSRFVVQN
jgi:hypothetical protein